MKGRSGRAAAAREAFEEAGVLGDVARKSIGGYEYMKFLKSGAGQPCRVKVFPMRVTTQLEEWPEREQRSARWFAWPEAAAAVQEAELGRLIEAFAMAKGKPLPAADPALG